MRQLAERDSEQLARDAQRVPADDVGRRAHAQTNAFGATVGEVDCDLGAGVPRADDEHVLATEGLGVDVVGGVDDAPVGTVEPRPRGNEGLLAEAARDDDESGFAVAGRGVQCPGISGAVDPSHFDAELRLDPVMAGVRDEVVGVRVLRDPFPGRSVDRQARQAREPADRVEVETLVAGSPGGADLLRALEHDAVDPLTPQHRRDGEAGRPGSHDRDRRSHLSERTPYVDARPRVARERSSASQATARRPIQIGVSRT